MLCLCFTRASHFNVSRQTFKRQYIDRQNTNQEYSQSSLYHLLNSMYVVQGKMYLILKASKLFIQQNMVTISGKHYKHYNMSHTRKPDFCLCANKATDHCAVTAQLISTFVFVTPIVQFLLYLYPKFQDSNFFLRLYRPIFVRRGRKARRPVFSRRSSYMKRS